jgi:hypothetical protein
MSDAEKIIWGAFGAVAVYIVGQLLSKFFVDPLYELRKTIGEVRFSLSFHAPTINTPIGRSKETSDAASDALRKNSSDLIAKLDAVPFYVVTRILSFGTFPSRKDVEAAAVQLRALSTYVHEEGPKANASLDVIRKRIAKIKQLLRMRPLEEEK